MKIAKIPLPSRENTQVLPLEEVGDEYQRVVFDKDGNSYRTDFLSEEEKDQEINDLSSIQANIVYEERIPETESIAKTAVFNSQYLLPAQFAEGTAINALSLNGTVPFFESFNQDGIVTYSSSTGEFQLPPGYVYKLTAYITARSEDENYAGAACRWFIDGSYVGNAGACRSYDRSGQVGDDYCDITISDAIAFYINNTFQTVSAKILIVDLMNNTTKTNGFSQVEIEIIRNLVNG